MVVIVVVILIVVVVAIVGVIVVTIFGVVVVVDDVSLIFKLSLMIIGWAYAFHQDKASSVKVPVANVTLFSSTHLLQENTDSVCSNQRIRPTAYCSFRTIKVERLIADKTLCSFLFLLARSSIRLVGLQRLAMAAVCASRAAVKSAVSCRMASKVMAGVSDVDVLLGGILST
ncbi:hypothetical protein Tco_0111852 [Tanacetum coccineum]